MHSLPSSYSADVAPHREGSARSVRSVLGTRLREAAGRQTRQKLALSKVLEESDQFLSAQRLHAVLRAQGEKVGLTTVYSQLRTLADAGVLSVFRADDGEMLYRRCETEGHHHHLVCRRCGATTEVNAPDVEAWASEVAASRGYCDVAHTIAIVGLCRECATGLDGDEGRPPGPPPKKRA